MNNSLFERIVLLKGVPFFELLRTEQLRHLAAALEPVAWVAGSQVFAIGDPGDSMFLITEGRVAISLGRPPQDSKSAKPGDHLDELVIARLGPGECFGEMGLLDDQPRSATASVLENTTGFSLGKEKMRGLLLSYPELGMGMLRAMSRRLRDANHALIQMTRPPQTD